MKSTSAKPITMRRRDLLRGLGAGAAFVAPFARQLTARAASPGNLIIFYTPNGFVRSMFGSDGNDATFKLRRGMAKAEPMKHAISVVRGLSGKSQHPGRPFHDQGIARLLTCIPGSAILTGYGPSIDHVVAGLTPNPPLTLSVYWAATFNNNGTFVALSWKKAGISDRYINDTKKAYAAAFGGFMPSGNTAELMAAVEQEKSLLDFIKSDVDLFKGRLATADKARLETHYDALRELEKKVAGMPGTGGGGAGCKLDAVKRAETFVTPPVAGAGGYKLDLFKAHGDVQLDIMATAVACGLRNAGSIMWQAAASGINPNGLSGKADDHHNVSHGEGGATVWSDIDNWYAGRYAQFLKQLEDLGALDRTVVTWASEIAESHSHNNCTFVVGGGKALGIKHQKTAQFAFVGGEGGGLSAAMNPANRDIGDLWLTLGKACGVQMNKFGSYGDKVVSEIWAPA